MQKSLIFIALSGALCTAAQAQSSLTVYGVVDMNYTTLSGNGRSRNVMDPGGISGSRLGFRGSEDLGNGLKAIFELEYGSLKIDANQGISGARQSFVGLKGAWGSILGGYIYSPADDFNSGYDGLSNSGLLSARANMLNDGGFSTKVDDTFTNAVAYISPSLGGLTLRAVVGLGEQESSPKEKKYAFGAEYIRGAFKTALVYHYIDNQGGVAPAANLRETALGIGYDFGVAKLLGTYAMKKASGGGDDISWALGAQIPAGAGSVRLSYAALDMSTKSGGKDARGWSAAYFHDLSKRTTLYTGYHALDNGSTASYNHERLTGLSAGSNARLFTVGMRHKF
ncbi:MAG: porin [Rhodocyclales bacterium]|nr:porin [Rhodocyclales bacterium]